MDIDAAGFLPRRTTVAGPREFALWPADGEEEARAIRTMVYGQSLRGGTLQPMSPGEFYVSMSYEGVDPRTVFGAWTNEARGFGAMFGLDIQVVNQFQYDVNEISVMFLPRWQTCEPSAVRGFCQLAPPYFQVLVDPQRATEPAVIRRVLASWFLGSNPLPGLMNVESPTDALSLLEKQAIRMTLLRSRPNRYPDTDR